MEEDYRTYKTLSEANQIRLNYYYENHKGVIPVDIFLDVETDDSYWFAIPGYNGYEISSYGLVRSMKNFRRYPYGILLKPLSDKGSYILSNDYNVRVTVTRDELWDLAMDNPRIKSNGYPRRTKDRNVSSRNRRMFIDFKKAKESAHGKTIHRSPKELRVDDEVVYYPKFYTVINDSEED